MKKHFSYLHCQWRSDHGRAWYKKKWPRKGGATRYWNM